MSKNLNQKELGERWGFSTRTLEQWRWQGRGPYFLKLGGRVAYREIDIVKFEIDAELRDTACIPDPESEVTKEDACKLLEKAIRLSQLVAKYAALIELELSGSGEPVQPRMQAAQKREGR